MIAPAAGDAKPPGKRPKFASEKIGGPTEPAAKGWQTEIAEKLFTESFTKPIREAGPKVRVGTTIDRARGCSSPVRDITAHEPES